jgi:hypothetical protein
MVKTWGVKKSLIALVVVLVVVAGIAVATDGKSSAKPASTPPAGEPKPTSTPAVVEPPVIMSFKVNPAAVSAGQPTNLSWEVNKATSVSIDQGIGTVSASGTRAISPAANTTYTLTATNSAGSVTATTSVSINVPLVPVIISFTATPSSVGSGQPANLQWSVTGATSISIDQGIGIVSSSWTQQVLPTATTTYTLVATNSAGSVTATATVTVGTATPPAITSFTATPSSVAAGSPVTLQWNVNGATSVSISQGIGTVSSSGTQEVSPAVTTTYILTARNNAGSVTASTAVTVGAVTTTAPVVTSFTANPFNINAGGSSTLSWNVNGATTVSIDQGIGTVSASGTRAISPAANTTYTLTATNSIGTVTASAPVTIITVQPPVITSFYAEPSSVSAGQPSTTLRWTIIGADSISIEPGIGTPQSQFQQVVQPPATTPYTLTATNSAGSVTATITVTKQ